LKEPSRPITPAGLDARIDYIPSSSESYGAYKSNTSSYLYANALTRSRGSNIPTSSHTASTAEGQSIKNQESQSTTRSDISLLLLDVQDTIHVLETESQNSLDHTALNQTLFNVTQTIDKFAKFMKANEASGSHQGPSPPPMARFSSSYSSLELYLRLISSLCRILDSTTRRTVRQHTCRHILRLHLIQYPMNIQESLSPDDARILLRTTRDMYLASQDTLKGNDEDDGPYPILSSDSDTSILLSSLQNLIPTHLQRTLQLSKS
jgi:hypothetical protein